MVKKEKQTCSVHVYNLNRIGLRTAANALSLFLSLFYLPVCVAQTSQPLISFNPYSSYFSFDMPQSSPGPMEERAKKEQRIPPNYFAIVFYKPTYILPYYHTGSPYNSIYKNNTPYNEGIKHTEMKYQLSFKVPVWNNFLNRNSTLYLAYTQLSYWQAYNNTAFFRETDYEPEFFLANQVNWPLMFSGWHICFFNIGAVHQSNGYGNRLERSWNRFYLEFIASKENWMVSIKPWLTLHDNSLQYHNPNINHYLGHGQILIAYKFYRQVFALQTHSLIESGGRRATAEFSWSFPITCYLNGYVQVFSGYGQSLIEYNHKTTSAGIGIALSNWV